MAEKKKSTGRIKAIKKELDGIIFDSTTEANYYEYLKEELAKGNIVSFELQPEYLLQEGFKKNGKIIRPIKYIGDFLITDNTGYTYVVDVKGFQTDDFKIKHKMFDYKYPELELRLIAYDLVTEQWMDYKEHRKLVNARKKERAAAKAEKDKLKAQKKLERERKKAEKAAAKATKTTKKK